mmetsp:Transcript_14484/g.47588  ORF Transcript_14484/g.47588 Transcript_14484/m.47588 type:complete len:171 (-) Transcript_14484:402-914(-)
MFASGLARGATPALPCKGRARARDAAARGPALRVHAAKGFGSSSKGQSEREAEEGESGTAAPPGLGTVRFEPTADGKPRVISPAVEAINAGGEQTVEAKYESYFLVGMGGLFTVIIIVGIIIALSAFLPDSGIDKLATDVLYPNFSNLILAFLAFSSAYGLFKTQQLGRG